MTKLRVLQNKLASAERERDEYKFLAADRDQTIDRVESERDAHRDYPDMEDR